MSEAENSAEQKAAPRYHHGDLRAALLQAGEEELTANGYVGFTLRGTAKRAGVSHAAPAHYFRDANALLTALAARGFARLSEAMRAAEAGAAPDPQAQLIASGIGYYRFGMENPALLQLMFGQGRPGDDDPDLQRNGSDAFGILVANVSAQARLPALERSEGHDLIACAWSIVHGFTMLALAQRLGFLSDGGQPTLEDHLRRILAAAFPSAAPDPTR